MIVWLASYPRSGNTLSRIILFHIFGFKTYSIYNDRLGVGSSQEIKSIVGHEFLPEKYDLDDFRNSEDIFFIKTHELFKNSQFKKEDKVLYLARDGRASSFSYSKYLQDIAKVKGDTLKQVLKGDTPYGYWGQHVLSWQKAPLQLIRYEDMLDNLDHIIKLLAKYLEIKPIRSEIPSFESLHNIHPKFFRSGKKDEWRRFFTPGNNIHFWCKNFKAMKLIGYI